MAGPKGVKQPTQALASRCWLVQRRHLAAADGPYRHPRSRDCSPFPEPGIPLCGVGTLVRKGGRRAGERAACPEEVLHGRAAQSKTGTAS
jgi:hypothetical protein